jgi:LCP family protein required for cell wall assembly
LSFLSHYDQFFAFSLATRSIDAEESRWPADCHRPRGVIPIDDEPASNLPEPPAPADDRDSRQRTGRRIQTSTAILASLAVLLAVVVGGGALAVYLKYRAAWNGIARVNVSGDLHKVSRPPADPNAENILVIGSDTAVGVNGETHSSTIVTDALSDTIMLVHIAPGARQIDVLSFPRDSVVPLLDCAPEGGTPGQTAQPAYDIEQINATYAYGGPGCLWETIEQTTGIHINDFVELTFTGFVQTINALHGVNVCLPEAVNDPVSALNLPAGVSHVYGPEALAFWRTRENLGTGSDPQRIQRDQFLMASLFQGIEHSGLLSSPATMLSVIDTLTSHQDVVTDSGLTPLVMLRLGEDLRGIKGDSVQFVTVPWTTYTGNAQWINSSETPNSGNPNWVQWVQPQANDLFSAIAHDTSLPKAAKAPTSSTVETVSPADVRVQVLNGSHTYGLATSTSASLTQRGFTVIGSPSDAATNSYTGSLIEYSGAAELPEAQALAQIIPNVTLQQDPSLTGTTLQLILGSTFTALLPASNSSTPPSTGNASTGLSSIATTYGGITGSTNICSDGGAFSG